MLRGACLTFFYLLFSANLQLHPLICSLTIFFSLQTDGELLKGDVLTADPLFLLPLGNPNTFSTIFNGSELFSSSSKTKVPRDVKLALRLKAQMSLLFEGSTIQF